MRVRQECLEAFGLTVAEAAGALGVTRQALNNVVSGRSGITPEMAVRLSKAVGNDPDFWLRLQRQYDVAQVLKEARRIKVVPFSKLAREKARGVVRARALRAALPRSGFEAREIDAMKREGRP